MSYRFLSRPTLIVTCLLFLCLIFDRNTWAAAHSHVPTVGVSWLPAKPVRGSPLLFRAVAPASAKAVSGSWMGHELMFFRSSGNTWYALAGVPVETKPGSYDLTLAEMLPTGSRKLPVRKVKIWRASYPRIAIHVAKQYTEPSPEQLKQVAEDKTLKQRVFATETPERLWSGSFEAPVNAAVSDVYGTERVFNGEVQSRHLGLDYGVPTGTEVHAVNSGVVILARPLYFEGGLVVIDHGQGLMSLYLHLSDFRVKEGENVQKGQLIALSGGSGRATGPHLHLAIRWQGVYLSPATLLQLELPK